jgi:hypothetical protein
MMILKHAAVVMVLVFGCLGSVAAFADSTSAVYQYYMDEGVRALEENDNIEAARCFDRARLIAPEAPEPGQYLAKIRQRTAGSYTPAIPLTDNVDEGAYKKALNAGINAMALGDRARALDLFYQAHGLNAQAQEPVLYINLIKRLNDGQVRSVAAGTPLPDVYRAAVPVTALPAASTASTMSLPREKKAVETINLDDVLNSGDTRQTVYVEYGSSLVVEGRNIQRFLAVDSDFLVIKIIGRDQLRIEARRRGKTFVHIWDDRGRTTVAVEVILPRALEPEPPKPEALLEHSRPFKMYYTLDNSLYHSGPDVFDLHRRSMSIRQTLGIDGPTPYGFFDASLAADGFAPIQQIPTYTMGLTNIPMPGTSDLDLRIFDSSRSLTPLAMPSTRLRGVFADARFFKDIVGLSVSHGAQMSSLAVTSSRNSRMTKDAYIDAVQLALFPLSQDSRYTLNYARGYGRDRDRFLTRRVVSVEGLQKIGGVGLNAELARGDRTSSELAGIRWANGRLNQAVNFRNLRPGFTTIVSEPSNAGEIGALWTTMGDFDRLATDTYMDVYRDRIFPNRLDPEELNYDTSAHSQLQIGEHYRWDTTGRYLQAPGIASPRRNVSGDTRLTRDVPYFGGRKGSVYAGGSTQYARYSFTPESEFDRKALVTGLSLPLTEHLSGFVNYEYSWLHEKLTEDNYNPAVLTAGLTYTKDITDKLVLNLGVTYRDEQDVAGPNSFLGGEDSISYSAGLSYTPMKDLNFFVDSRLRNVLAQIDGNPSYNDLDVRFGMRMAFGLGFSWDPQGMIGGFVFKDRNGNKEFEPDDIGLAGDEGLAGVKVRIGNKEAVTDARGWYQLPVTGTRVTVTPVFESLPAGAIFSTPMSVRADIVQGHVRRIDFGLTTQAGIYGVAFADKNGNGIPDDGDKFVGRIKISLDGKHVQATDASGAYFFKNVNQGRHRLKIDLSSISSDYIPTVKVQNDLDVAEGTTYIFHIPLKVKTP